MLTCAQHVEKWTWEEVAGAIASKQYHLLGRSEEQLQSYFKHKEEVLSTYASMGDFLLEEVFHYDCVATPVPAAEGGGGGGGGAAAGEAAETRLKAKKPNGHVGGQIVWRVSWRISILRHASCFVLRSARVSVRS